MIVESKVQDFYKKLEENVTSDKLISSFLFFLVLFLWYIF